MHQEPENILYYTIAIITKEIERTVIKKMNLNMQECLVVRKILNYFEQGRGGGVDGFHSFSKNEFMK